MLLRLVTEPAWGWGGDGERTHREAQLAELLGAQGSPALSAEVAGRDLTLRLKGGLAQRMEELPLLLEGEQRRKDAGEPHTSRFPQYKPTIKSNVHSKANLHLPLHPEVEESRTRLVRRALQPVSRDPWSFSCGARTG